MAENPPKVADEKEDASAEKAKSLIVGAAYESPPIHVVTTLLLEDGSRELVEGDFVFTVPTLQQECQIGALMMRLNSGNVLDFTQAREIANPSAGIARMCAELTVVVRSGPKTWWRENPSEYHDVETVNAVYDAYSEWISRFRSRGRSINKVDGGK